MDFQSVNLLNVQINIFSGNLFPMTADDSRFSIGWKIYSIITWSINISMNILFFFGFTKVSKEKVISDGMIGIVILVEVCFIFTRIYACRDLVVQFIKKINDILRVQDETMKCIVMATLKLMHSPLKFYWMSSMITVTMWTGMPLIMIFKKNSFFYEDYRLPFVITEQPFSMKIFALGSLCQMLSSIIIIMKKAAADIYMMHLVLLMTAQYRYVAVKLRKVFQKKNLQEGKIHSRKKLSSGKIDSWTEREMKSIYSHQSTIMELSLILKKFLSLNFSLIYISTILRFSFIGVILTSNVSTKITDMAFHEKWYQFGSSIKRSFILMILSNNLKCEIALIKRFNLSLPSFMTVIKQAYSITLLCLKIIKK
ncbi:uncharacterized protein LOC126858036 [Cataglyphis hispanica]|uniref:uncharacterized protein LOC126858036 n=1 Tax=Cataglyphis hispanica TaxID=1086592 RepID=UPI00217F6A51|nr:uncharacterized protein LOC126858036 [Cataglyphis hispanica]